MFSLPSTLYASLHNETLKHVDEVVIRKKEGESCKSKQKRMHNIIIIIGNKVRGKPARELGYMKPTLLC